MKVSITIESMTATMEGEDAVTWMDACELMTAALKAQFPYLTEKDIAEYFEEKATLNSRGEE